VAVMAVIFWFSAQIYDGHDLAWWEPTARTLGHFGGFGLLALAWAWALGPLTRRWLPLAAALSVSYAFIDEYHQSFVEGRSSSWEDIVVDSLGIACALLLARSRNLRGTARGEPGR
jgi:VanZ family protein